MPNYCQNKLIVKGDKKRLDKFVKKYLGKDLEFSFNSIVPQPKNEKELMKKYPTYYVDDSQTYWGNDSPTWIERHFDWYPWCLKYWGTKWDAMKVDVVRENDNELIVWFDTAWNPPINVILELVDKEPKLTIELTYYEGGMGFGGSVIYGLDIGHTGDLEEWRIKEGFDDRF